jgi:autotransporter-associated beta strand protein
MPGPAVAYGSMGKLLRDGIFGIFLLGVFLASPGVAFALACEWTGMGADNRWSTSANWTNCGGRAPAAGDRIIFPADARQPASENDIAGLSVLSIDIAGVAEGDVRYDLAGLAITVGDAIVVKAPPDASDRGPIVRAPIVTPVVGNFAFSVQVALLSELVMAGPLTLPAGRMLIKDVGGTLVLANAANRWDMLRVDEGSVKIGVAGALPDSAAFALAKTGMLDLNGLNETIGTLSGNPSITIGPRIRLGSGTLTIQQAKDEIFQGNIFGTGGIVKNGGGALTLSRALMGTGENTYTGTTTVNDGVLELFRDNQTIAIPGPLVIAGGVVRIRGDHQIADTAPVTVNAPGVLDLNGFRDSIGPLSGSGAVRLGTGRLIIGMDDEVVTFSGAITGSPVGDAIEVITQMGGTLALTGDSAVGGFVAVRGGHLTIDGRLDSRGVVVDNSTLAGSGMLANTSGATLINRVTLTATSVLAPGHDAGTLRADEAVFDQGILEVRLLGLTAGAGYSQLKLSTSYRLSAATSLDVGRGTFAPPSGSTFTIIDLASAGTGQGTFANLPEGATFKVQGQDFRITYRGGPDGNDIVLTAAGEPPPITYFLSEGATGAFFDEDVVIANPNDAAAPVTLTFSKENGEQVVATRTVSAMSRTTVRADAIPGLENTAASLQVRSDRGMPLAVERSMFWDPASYAGHTGGAVSSPSTNWFFAEGSQGFFQTFVLIINPATTATDVTFTFLRENEPAVVKTITLGASSRLTLHAGDVPGLVHRSFGIAISATQPIMAERAMYFGTTPTRLWSGGHESAGVTSGSTDWFLAEGATGAFFDTFILMSNPQQTPANVTVQYLLDTGETVTVPKTIPASTRLTTNIEAEADTRLHNAAVSTVVTSDVPIIVERSMYWPGAVRPWGEAHNSFGVVSAGTTWGLAEGRVGGPLNFHTFILLANPETTAAEVRVTFLREGAAPIVQTYTVPPTSRFNIDSSGVPGLKDESFGALISVTNRVPIVVERSMYWDVNGIAFSGGTNATGIALSEQP